MTSTVTIRSLENVEFFEDVDDVFELLFDHFKGSWPSNAVLKLNGHKQSTKTIQDLQFLEGVHGRYEVLVQPQGLIAAAVGVGAILSSSSRRKRRAALVSRSLAAINDQEDSNPSPNNKIADRSNSVRAGKRIPDIFGKADSTPDVIFPAYESGGFELGLYCIGRGDFEIENVFEGDDTLLSTIPGASAEVYGPGKSPNNAEPDLRIGAEITEPLAIYKLLFDSENDEGDVFTEEAEIVLELTLGGEDGPSVGGAVEFVRSTDQASTQVGFNVNSGQTLNFTATNPYAGIPTAVRVIRTTAANQQAEYYTEEEWAALNAAQSTNYPYDDGFGNNPVKSYRTLIQEFEDITLAELKPFTQSDFGDVTIVYTKTPSRTTEGSSNVDRRLNLKVVRKIPVLLPNFTLSPPTGTSDAASIIVAIATDPFIGRQNLADLDLENIRQTIDEVAAHFGDVRASEFNYTFDEQNVSFEDTLRIVCETVFCSAFREGSQIKIAFEKQTDIPVILFSDYNKLPGNEKRSVSFGTRKDYDGVTFEYVNPNTGEVETIDLPDDGSANNPEPVKMLAVRSKFQAYFHAKRFFNRLFHETSFVTFDATQEATLLKVDDKILVSDNTKPNSITGRLVSVDGMTLTLSREVKLYTDNTYTIFIQDAGGSVISREVSQGVIPTQVVIATDLTGVVLSLDENAFSVSNFQIVKNTDAEDREFLVVSKTPKEGLVVSIEAVNYDDRYYQNDLDFVNGVVLGSELDDTAGVAGLPATAPFFRNLQAGSLHIFKEIDWDYGGPTALNVSAAAYDINGDSITYTLEGADAALFNIDPTTGLISFVSYPDHGNPLDSDGNNFYEIIVKISDGTLFRTAPITIWVTDDPFAQTYGLPRPPLPPFFNNLTNNQESLVQENVAVSFFTVSAYDVNGQTLTFSISGGDDAAEFTIGASNGELEFVTPPDFETPTDANTDNTYEVEIQVSDGSLSTRALLKVIVTDDTGEV